MLPGCNTSTVLDPTQKDNHFKKHWSADLHQSVLAEAEEIVRDSKLTCVISHCVQFKERYIELFGNGEAPQQQSTSSKKSAAKKVKTLLRELSSDDEDPTPVGSADTPVDPQKPWRKEFYRYLHAIDELNGLTIVQWWGVCPFYFFH
jgi:hypothetical protein